MKTAPIGVAQHEIGGANNTRGHRMETRSEEVMVMVEQHWFKLLGQFTFIMETLTDSPPLLPLLSCNEWQHKLLISVTQLWLSQN